MRSTRRAARTTRAPAAPRTSAKRLPNPEDAPVTTAVPPSKANELNGSFIARAGIDRAPPLSARPRKQRRPRRADLQDVAVRHRRPYENAFEKLGSAKPYWATAPIENRPCLEAYRAGLPRPIGAERSGCAVAPARHIYGTIAHENSRDPLLRTNSSIGPIDRCSQIYSGEVSSGLTVKTGTMTGRSNPMR